MKFFCERCKTRYSIADDRVRGKILKIRCKNCANVITVREGMSADDEELPRGRTTTQAPTPGEQMPAHKPPAALQEEWYLSIDGVQSGPYALPDAQRWIAEKPFDADLHCWSEGFDDWLPVDKVSHFRGLRKSPAPAAPPTPPPMPARPTAPPPIPPAGAPAAAPLEAAAPARAIAPPPPTTAPPPPTTAPLPLPATNGIAGRANGTGPTPMFASAARPAPIPPRALEPDAFDTPPEASAIVDDDEEDDDEDDGPFSGLRSPAAAPSAPDLDESDDDLNIGEVSRVVNLADLARAAEAKRKPPAPVTAPTPRPALAPLAAARAATEIPRSPLDATASVEALPPVPEVVAAAPVAQAQRRGLILLVSAAVVLLAGVTIAVVLTLGRGGGDDDTATLTPTSRAIDTSRPDEVVHDRVLVPTPTPEANAQHPIGGRRPLMPNGTQQTQSQEAQPAPHSDEPDPNRLKPEEIEQMAANNSTGTQRCYMRAQRGVDGIEIGDVKKITVTLVVDKGGAVSEVQLSDHATDSLGMCLASQIKRWKFRETAGGGQYRFALAFAGN